jgi:glycosyltransferase involved in cell wall biosynthesis
MSDPALVSIITAAYNAEAHIAETIRSVLAQTYSHWEWIVVDDGSTDATREIVAAIADPRVRLVAAEHSGLPAAARNRGVTEARGKYVAILDADDVWTSDKLAAQMACFEAHPEAGLVFSRFRCFFQEVGRLAKRSVPNTRGVSNPSTMFAHLCIYNLICTSTVIVRRSMLDAHGLMDEDPRQRGSEDYELWLRLAPHAPFAWVDRPLVHYRVHPAGLSARAVPIVEGRSLALDKALRRNPNAPLHPQLAGRRMEAWKLFWLGHAQSYDGVESSGRRALWRSIRIYPRNGVAWVWLALSFLGPRLNARLRRLAYRIV